MHTTPLSPSEPASRLDQALAKARGQGRAALIAYLPAGYPTLDQSLDALHLLATTADVIEMPDESADRASRHVPAWFIERFEARWRESCNYQAVDL